MPKNPIRAPHNRQNVRLGNKGGFAVPGDTDEAIMCKKPQARQKNRIECTWNPGHESNQTEVLESMKGIGSPTANVHRVGDGCAADA